MLVLCHVLCSLFLQLVLGLLFILSVGCVRGREEGAEKEPFLPNASVWVGNASQSRDMKGIIQNCGDRLLKLFFSFSTFLHLTLFTSLSFFPLSLSPRP